MAASIGDIYQASIMFAGPGGTSQINLGFTCVAPDAGDAQINLGAAIQQVLLKNTSGGLLYEASPTFSSTRLEIEDIKPGTLATYVRTYPAVTGGSASDALPPQCSVVMSLRTALKGRSYRGRVYLPGAGDGFATAGTLTPTAVTNYTTIVTNLLAAFGPLSTNGTWELAVISRWLNKVKRVTPVATKVTSASIDPTVRTQRRRVAGVGS